MYVSDLNVFLAQPSIGLGLCQLLLFLVSLFLILLVLVQRGKGGGLTGALGGMGGQSAFGTKAGDAFTRITIITTLIWITLCMVTISRFNPPPAAKVTKKMTLMEKARALDYAPSIGAPAGADDASSDVIRESIGASAGGSDMEDNVAEKQTPENTATMKTEAMGTGSAAEGSTESATGEGVPVGEGTAVPAATIETPATTIETPAATIETPAATIETPAVTIETPAVTTEVPATTSEVPATVE